MECQENVLFSILPYSHKVREKALSNQVCITMDLAPKPHSFT